MDERYLDPSEALAVGGMRDDNINISDVIEVIETDPDFTQSSTRSKAMFNGGGEIAPPPMAPIMSKRNAVLRILEQPASKALRFRYECEGRSAGSIPGSSSTPENKTFPTIQIQGYQGRAVVVVSCVTKDEPYRPHPHNLVGREGCKKGICTMHVPPETMTVTFSNLGIQCVKKKDIEAALRLREEIKVDPYKTGFSHRNQPTSIDLNAVRLCFQTFLESDTPGKYTIPIKPVVSEPIYDKKAMSDLVIVKLSDCVSSVDGGRKDIILLCEKVAKEDIKVHFYEEKDGRIVWEGNADFQPSQVHKQTAIWFRAPRYHKLDITDPVRVFIQLQRPSDGATSEPLPFEYLPLDSDPGVKLKRKRYKFESDSKTNSMLLQLQEQECNLQEQECNRGVKPEYNMLNIAVDDIKSEPRETSPSPYRNQVYGGVSPLYAQNAGLSPHYPLIDPLGPTPPPTDIQFNLPYRVSQPQMNNQSLPPISNVMSQSWNILSASTMVQHDLAASAMNIDSASGLSSLLDMDSQQLRQINLNSGELATLNMFDTNNLSENLSNNLSLIDIPRVDQNMTDSLTRLANTTIENMFLK